MSSKKKANEADAHEEVWGQADGLLRRAFDMLNSQFKQIAADFTRLEERRRAVKEEIRRGARRTDGQIV